MEPLLSTIIPNFQVQGTYLAHTPCVNGHINDTYKLITHTNSQKYAYSLQKINHHIFLDVPALMSNIHRVTSYLHDVIVAEGRNPIEETLTIIKTRNDQLFFHDVETDTYWRVYHYIGDANSEDFVDKATHLYLCGLAFGTFQKRLNRFDIGQLVETIPYFHHTEKRFQAFRQALQSDRWKRAELIKEECDFLLQREDYAGRILRLIAEGAIPIRVTHNDTKLNNVLINPVTYVFACIDLDTVMPGSLLYDFGDSIRSGATNALEDEQDLSKVTFELDRFQAYTRGFVQGAREILTTAEIEQLAFGAILMTFECGLRFLTDYLNGDTYFKIKRPGHNLDRARTQIKLVKDMEHHFQEMQDSVLSCIHSANT